MILRETSRPKNPKHGGTSVTPRHFSKLSISIALVLSLAACGGSDDEGSTADAPTNTEATNGTDASGTDAAGTGSSGGAASPTNDPWQKTAAEFELQIGDSGTHECPPDGVAHQLWGTGPFTDDSSICTAAVFAGVIDLAGGGTVTFTIVDPLPSYDGGESNGVVANEYGEWPGAFTIDID
jgi:hypothetical protein